jgi:hypothetical protein
MTVTVEFEIKGAATVQSVPVTNANPGTIIQFAGMTPGINDGGGSWDATNHWYVVPQTGYYWVYGEIFINEAGSMRAANIAYDGGMAIEGQQTSGVTFPLIVNGMLKLTLGHHLQLALNNKSGSTVTVQWGTTKLGCFCVGV